MSGSYETVLSDLRARRSQIDAAILAVEALAPTSTNGHAKPKTPAKVRAAKAPAKVKAAPAPTGKRAEKTAEIQRRLAAGESLSEVARAMGLTPQTVSYHRSKGGKATAKAAAKPGSGPAMRCQECGQKGIDPVRCDHCGEKR